jgi:hypothetical protein
MSKNHDQFDLDRLRLNPKEAEAMAEAHARSLGPQTQMRHKNLGRNTKVGSSRKRQEAFVQMQTTDAVAGCQALKCPQALVWHEIHYRVWATGSPTISLPNEKLVGMGVSRKVKWRALHRLEQAGLIKVERRERRSPLVTLLPIRRQKGRK